MLRVTWVGDSTVPQVGAGFVPVYEVPLGLTNTGDCVNCYSCVVQAHG